MAIFRNGLPRFGMIQKKMINLNIKSRKAGVVTGDVAEGVVDGKDLSEGESELFQCGI
jgi:hypothetical protein